MPATIQTLPQTTEVPQTTEALVRSVVEQVLARVGPWTSPASGRSLTGRHGSTSINLPKTCT